jgi:hypothetical protein
MVRQALVVVKQRHLGAAHIADVEALPALGYVKGSRRVNFHVYARIKYAAHKTLSICCARENACAVELLRGTAITDGRMTGQSALH